MAKTLFNMGVMPERTPWVGAIDPISPPTVDLYTRDQILGKIKPALGKAKELSDLIQWSHEHDPWLKNFFGEDQGAFWMAWESIHRYRPMIDSLMARMGQNDPSAWTDLTEDEASAMEFWPEAVEGVYELYHAKYNNLPAVQRPGAAQAVTPVAVPPAPLAPSSKSSVSENILIGGAVLVALGAFVYALT